MACLRTAFISRAGSLDLYPVRRDRGGDSQDGDGASVRTGGQRTGCGQRTEFNKPRRVCSLSLHTLGVRGKEEAGRGLIMAG